MKLQQHEKELNNQMITVIIWFINYFYYNTKEGECLSVYGKKN